MAAALATPCGDSSSSSPCARRGSLAVLALGDRRAARDLLPDGAALALELRGAGGIFERIEETRFAAAFAAGPTCGLARAQRGRARARRAARGDRRARPGSRRGGATSSTSSGSDAAVAWYPPPAGVPGTLAGAPWVAAGRLSLRAWALASAARLAARLGLGRRRSPARRSPGDTVATVGSGRRRAAPLRRRAAARRGERPRAGRAAPPGSPAGDGAGADRRPRTGSGSSAALPADGAAAPLDARRAAPAAGRRRMPRAPRPGRRRRRVRPRRRSTIDVFVDAPDAVAPAAARVGRPSRRSALAGAGAALLPRRRRARAPAARRPDRRARRGGGAPRAASAAPAAAAAGPRLRPRGHRGRGGRALPAPAGHRRGRDARRRRGAAGAAPALPARRAQRHGTLGRGALDPRVLPARRRVRALGRGGGGPSGASRPTGRSSRRSRPATRPVAAPVRRPTPAFGRSTPSPRSTWQSSSRRCAGTRRRSRGS